MIAIRHIVMPMALLASAALTACGGGGGGGSNDGANSTPSSVEKYAITADNYDQVVASAGAAAGQASNSGRSGAQLVGAESRAIKWGQLAQAAVSQVLALQGEQTVLLGAAQSQACATSGTMSVNKEGAGANDTPAVNEVITATFTACVDPTGVRFDGNLKIKVTKLDAGNVSGMNLDFSSLKVLADSVTETLDGAMSVTILPDLYVVNSPALRIVTASAGVTQTDSWSNFLYTWATSSEGKQLSIGGVLVSSELGNKSVEVTTPVALTFIGEAPVPNSGKVVIKGANNSIATLTVNSEVTPVTISVDANGDGTPEKSKQVDWDQIGGADLS